MKNSTLRVAACVFLIAGLPALTQAAFSPPPSWMPMSMLNVTYSTTTQQLSVVDEATKLGAGVYAALAIDTYSDPSVTSGSTAYARSNFAATAFGSFDSAEPWGLLNNTAFSRRLGWYDPTGTLGSAIQAAYGAGASIWIECLSASPGLEAYQAVGLYGVSLTGTLDSNNVPVIDPAANGYAPIFGAGTSSTKWQWDYGMDHNVYAVQSQYITAPNQLFTAQYKVYVGDSQGNEILNPDGSSPSCDETWTWQGPANVPEPATLALLAAGAGLTVMRIRRRK